MSIALSPDHMTAAERLDEVAEVLATGAMRLLARKSTPLPADRGESSVDFTANRSVDGADRTRRSPR